MPPFVVQPRGLSLLRPAGGLVAVTRGLPGQARVVLAAATLQLEARRLAPSIHFIWAEAT